MSSLPALGASKEYVISAGFSSGAETSAHLMLAYPEVFGCVGVLDGGFPLTLQRTQRTSGEDYVTDNTDDEDYAALKGEIEQMVSDGQLGDQSKLKQLNRAMYIFAGDQDDVVLPWATREIKRYFEELGGNV